MAESEEPAHFSGAPPEERIGRQCEYQQVLDVGPKFEKQRVHGESLTVPTRCSLSFSGCRFFRCGEAIGRAAARLIGQAGDLREVVTHGFVHPGEVAHRVNHLLLRFLQANNAGLPLVLRQIGVEPHVHHAQLQASQGAQAFIGEAFSIFEVLRHAGASCFDGQHQKFSSTGTLNAGAKPKPGRMAFQRWCFRSVLRVR